MSYSRNEAMSLQSRKQTVGLVFLILLGVGVLLGLMTVWGSWYTVDEGQRGVILRNGAIVGEAEPGLGFKVPFVDSVREFSVRTNKATLGEAMAYTYDAQVATVRLSMNYRVDPTKVVEVYQRFTSIENMESVYILPRMFENLKAVFGTYRAERAYRDRGKLTADVTSAVTAALTGVPIMVEGVQLENIDFSDAFEEAVERQIQMEVEVRTEQQRLEKERVVAEQAVVRAQGVADSTLNQAKADAQAIELRGLAEARSIEARGSAIAQNPGLPALVTAERWDGKLPTTIPPNGTVPFLSLTPR